MQAAPVEPMLNRQKFLSKVQRADLPQQRRELIAETVEAICDGFEDDEDEARVVPNIRSFARMLDWLSNPHHSVWRAPAIGLTAEGLFVAVWQQPGSFRWALEFEPDGSIKEIYFEVAASGLEENVREQRVGPSVTPPFAESRLY